jgi:dihydroneopterin aldolase
MGLFTIQLEECEFFAHHGIHQSEKINGNTFWVSVSVHIDASYFEDKPLLENTIDYQAVYNLVSNRMSKATELLEQVAMDIANDLAELSSKIESAEVSISKSAPPIGGKCRRSTVSYHRVY